MNVSLSPIFNGWQGFTPDGIPLNGGLVGTFLAGSSTPAATFTDSSGGVANANPIVLGPDGRPPFEIWLTDGIGYKFVLQDSLLNTIKTYDNVSNVTGAANVLFDYSLTYAAGTIGKWLNDLALAAGSTFIGWTQAGTGAVLRTISSKLRDIVNVKDFGAVGDGIADDTTAIQNAIASLGPAGGVVNYQPGVFLLSAQLNLDDKFCVSMRAAGGRNVGGHVNGSILKYTAAGATSFISLRSSIGCGLHDLGIQFNNASFTGSLIDFSHSGGAGNDAAFGQVKNCYIGSDTGALTTGNGIKLDKAIEITIDGNVFAGGATAITGQDSASYSNVITISNNNFGGTLAGTIGVPIQGLGEAWRIVGNTFEQRATNIAGAIQNTALTPVQGLVIEGNWFGDATSGTSVWVTLFGAGIEITGNWVSGYLAGGVTPTCTGFSINNVAGCKFSGNYLVDLSIGVSFDTATTTGWEESCNSYVLVTNVYGTTSNQTSFTQAQTGHNIQSNGFLEHWGQSTVTTGTPLAITFTPNFSATPYAPTLTLIAPTGAANTTFVSAGYGAAGMTLNVNGTAGSNIVSWRMIGPGRV